MAETWQKVRCCWCQEPTPVHEHEFMEGLGTDSWRSLHPGKPWAPARRWVAMKALYYLAEFGVEFCSAICCTTWLRHHQGG